MDTELKINIAFKLSKIVDSVKFMNDKYWQSNYSDIFNFYL